MSEVYETKNDLVVLECDCGIIHKLKWNNETGAIELKSTVSKPKESKENKETNNNEQKEERKSIFGNRNKSKS